MKRLKRVLLAVLLMGGALLSAGFSLRKRFRSQQVGPDEINAVAIMGGTEQRFSNQTFKGGYGRAIMGGVELDLRDTTGASEPAVLEVTVVMGGVRVLVPQDWSVDLRVQPMMGGVADLRSRAEASTGSLGQLIIGGQVIMGGLAIAESREYAPE